MTAADWVLRAEETRSTAETMKHMHSKAAREQQEAWQ